MIDGGARRRDDKEYLDYLKALTFVQLPKTERQRIQRRRGRFKGAAQGLQYSDPGFFSCNGNLGPCVVDNDFENHLKDQIKNELKARTVLAAGSARVRSVGSAGKSAVQS